MRVAFVSKTIDATTDEELRATLDAAGLGTWSCHVPSGTISLSETCRALFGLSSMEPVSLARLEALVHPSDRAHRSAAISAALARGGTYDVSYRTVGPGGQVHWLRSRGRVLVDDTGKAVLLRGVIISVDEQKRLENELRASESHLRSILDSIPEGMIVIDELGIMHSFSAAAERLFGYSASELIGKNVSVLMPEPDRSLHDSYLRRYRQTGERRIIGIGRVVTGKRRDGSVFPMQLSVGEMRLDDRIFFTGFISDLTERRQTQLRIEELQNELVQVSRLTAMGEMASTLAHELNQPLAAISNYMKGCRRLLDQADPAVLPRIKEAMDKASEQAIRAGQIIRRLRDFVSRGELEKRPELVPRIIDEAAALALVGGREQGITTRFDLNADLPPVLVDRVQLQQVLVNLFRNAIDAMQQAPRRDLSISALPVLDGMVEISVADTGPGIAEEVSDRLFQPFVTTKQTGMGIGLSISRTIVESHGGMLWVERNADGGATFRLTVPSVDSGGEDGK
jgi:two-component system sensor kinase FixL